MGEVKFNNLGGNYGYYQKNDTDKKPQIQENVPEQKEAPVAPEVKNVAPDKVLDALSFMGAQNFAQISKVTVEPAKYLSGDRIASIEESMKAFEAGVEKYASAIKQEFGSVLSEEAILNLAANSFALQ